MFEKVTFQIDLEDWRDALRVSSCDCLIAKAINRSLKLGSVGLCSSVGRRTIGIRPDPNLSPAGSRGDLYIATTSDELADVIGEFDCWKLEPKDVAGKTFELEFRKR